jgi:hypothetical protein
LCREVDLRTDKVYRVEVSYMEIYNEGLYDLLADNPAAADNLAILDDASNTVVSISFATHLDNQQQQVGPMICCCSGGCHELRIRTYMAVVSAGLCCLGLVTSSA